jgi:sulfotransferase
MNKNNINNSNKEDKKFYFVSGMPRSGSTLLCNILNQNPKFHATGTSGVLDLILLVKNNWNLIAELKAQKDDWPRFRVLKSIMPAFYADIDRPIIFDKSRGWPAHMEMIEELMGHKVKVLVTVRDIRDILASFEKIWRKESRLKLISQERENMDMFQTVEGRCEVWLKANQPVGKAFNAIKDSLLRGYGDRMHFIFFEELTKNPEKVMKGVYEFLGEEYFEHNFKNVEQTTKEDDRIYGFTDLHTIRKEVKPLDSDWRIILGDQAEKYGKLNFWNNTKEQKIKTIVKNYK